MDETPSSLIAHYEQILDRDCPSQIRMPRRHWLALTAAADNPVIAGVESELPPGAESPPGDKLPVSRLFSGVPVVIEEEVAPDDQYIWTSIGGEIARFDSEEAAFAWARANGYAKEIDDRILRPTRVPRRADA